MSYDDLDKLINDQDYYDDDFDVKYNDPYYDDLASSADDIPEDFAEFEAFLERMVWSW